MVAALVHIMFLFMDVVWPNSNMLVFQLGNVLLVLIKISLNEFIKVLLSSYLLR